MSSINNKNNLAYEISVDEIIKCVKRLKQGKSDGEKRHNCDHVIYGLKIVV